MNEKKWIYESPDGGKTIFRRPFMEYSLSKKEEVDWKTKKPTGRKFTEYPFLKKKCNEKKIPTDIIRIS